MVAGRLAIRRARRFAPAGGRVRRDGSPSFLNSGRPGVLVSTRQLAVVDATGTTTVLDEHGSLTRAAPGRPPSPGRPTRGGSLLQRPGAILLADSASPGRVRVLVRGPRDWYAVRRRLHTRWPVRALPARIRRDRGDSRVGGHGESAPRLRGLGARRAIRVHPSAAARARRWPAASRARDRRPLRKECPSAGVFEFDDHGASNLIWSADGSSLLYESSVRAAHDLWAVDPDGSDLHRLTADGFDASAPAWSADGTRLAYASGAFSGGNCGYCLTSVVIAGADGRVQSTVPGGSAGQVSMDGRPSWDPLGTRLVVEVCCSGRARRRGRRWQRAPVPCARTCRRLGVARCLVDGRRHHRVRRRR